MQVVDLKGSLGEYLLDEERKISKNYLHSICRYQKGKETCKYICLSAKGFVCMKKTPMKKILDQRCKEGKMKAQSDNCGGLGKI